MEYTVRVHPRVVRQIAGWGLSEFLFMEVHYQIRQELPRATMYRLHRDIYGRGSLFPHSVRDPADTAFDHIFNFRVFFDEDERHLHVVHGSYWRNFDPR